MRAGARGYDTGGLKKISAAVLILGGTAALIAWLLTRPAPPREVPFARAVRRQIVSTITTNGKLEPVEFTVVRGPRDGAVIRLLVERGARIAAGSAVAELDSAEARTELEAARARLAQILAEQAVFEQGGQRSALTQAANAIARVQVDLDHARRQAASLEKLVAARAEPAASLDEARQRVRALETDLEAARQQREALIPTGSRESWEARRKEAETAVEAARRRVETATLLAPVSGYVYNVAVRPGSFIRAGDPVVEIGRIHELRATVYVDEPELGRVAVGLPIRITWDGAPGREWRGTVEKRPTQIVPFQSRQVGEVMCRLPNEDGALLPGANVNVEIQTHVAADALVIPKAAVRRDSQGAGVLLLAGDRVEWRSVRLGASSVTDAEIAGGLREGDAVALPTEGPLSPGERVLPRFP